MKHHCKNYINNKLLVIAERWARSSTSIATWTRPPSNWDIQGGTGASCKMSQDNCKFSGHLSWDNHIVKATCRILLQQSRRRNRKAWEVTNLVPVGLFLLQLSLAHHQQHIWKEQLPNLLQSGNKQKAHNPHKPYGIVFPVFLRRWIRKTHSLYTWAPTVLQFI